MVVAIDATPLTTTSGGVRRYTLELTQALSKLYPHDVYHLVSDQKFDSPPNLPRNVLTHSGPRTNVLDRRWWTVGIQRTMHKIGSELFHGTEFSVPYVPLKPSVLTLQDLSPWLVRSWHHAADRVRTRTPWLMRLRIATAIITPSEAIRRQAIAHFRLRPESVFTVPDAAAEFLTPNPSHDGLPPYFLYVGTIEPRKNVPALVSAWEQLRRKVAAELWIAGRMRRDAPPIGSVPGLRMLGEVDDSELSSLYSNAVACVYPSLYEGFGLPVLEAMKCGAPVITSNDPALLEVSGKAAIHVDAEDTAGLMAAMEGLLENPGERLRRREMSLSRAAEFSWERTAQLTREVYEEALRRFAA